MSAQLQDRIELRMDERGRGYATVNGHDLRCTFEAAVEKATAKAEEVTITLQAVVDSGVLADLAPNLKVKVQSAKGKGKEEAPPEEAA